MGCFVSVQHLVERRSKSFGHGMGVDLNGKASSSKVKQDQVQSHRAPQPGWRVKGGTASNSSRVFTIMAPFLMIQRLAYVCDSVKAVHAKPHVLQYNVTFRERHRHRHREIEGQPLLCCLRD
jgi:hypothetical protein